MAAEALSAPSQSKFKGALSWLGVMLALTLLAGGAGGFLGLRLVSTVKTRLDAAAKAESLPPEPKYTGDTTLRELPPIIANLADPATAWVRLQASIVIDSKPGEKPDVMLAQISEDLLGFIKTLSLAQIGGPSGLQHLREDLNERAQIRSQGRVRELIIETLVVQ